MTPPPSPLTSATQGAPSALGGTNTEPAGLSTGFGGLAAAPAQRGDLSAFDVCHAGVVVRALLFVHGVLGLGAAFAATDLLGWWLRFAVASAAALPALLLWLLGGCLGQHRLARLPVAGQWIAAVTWGGLCAVGAWWLWAWAQLAGGPGGGPPHGAVVFAIGCALAAALFQWLRQRARLLQPAATRARLAELQSRIRPHFLFNTLNTAIALVRVDPSRAETVLEDLAELFRVALADGDGRTHATLLEEIELARRYLEIEQLRFGARLQVRWELDPQADGAKLPPLLLQPLVENAVKHGVEPAAQGGMVRVRTRVRRGQVELLVVNSVSLPSSTPGHGIALRNVHERLKLMHDVAADFSARRDGDVYRVRIVVPL